MERLDNLNIAYEEFPEEHIQVLTVGRGDEAIAMFTGYEAKALHAVLMGHIPITEINRLINHWREVF